MKKILPAISLLAMLVLTVSSCEERDPCEPDDNSPMITFHNESCFKVFIYQNDNPNEFNPATFVCSLAAGQTLCKTRPPTSDEQMTLGDAFYFHYKVFLGHNDTETITWHASAEHTWKHIVQVMKPGGKYYHTIPIPQAHELRFKNGYITIQNTGATQFCMRQGDSMLRNMDGGGYYLATGQKGLYEISVPYLDESVNLNMLNIYSTYQVNFPAYFLERGQVCDYETNGASIVGPKNCRAISMLCHY